MVFLSRIYTKSGDQGETGLGDGSRVAKDHVRVAAYGEVDELNATLGLLVANCADYPDKSLVLAIQNDLFDLGADLCTPRKPEEQPGQCLRITAKQSGRLEQEIDRRNESLAPLRSFILAGGTPAAAWLHLARTVCRRAERSIITLSHIAEVNPNGIIYMNRLSDLLFVMARVANDNGRADVLWVPGQAT